MQWLCGCAAAVCLYVQENYVNHKPAIANSEEMHMKVQELISSHFMLG